MNVSLERAEVLLERLRRTAMSPGAALDATDMAAIRWAVWVCAGAVLRMREAERATRSEEDTQPIKPIKTEPR